MEEPETSSDCNYCHKVGYDKLGNELTQVNYSDIWKRKEIQQADFDARKRIVIQDLKKYNILYNATDLNYEVDPKGVIKWKCPEPNCSEFFRSPEQVRDHLFNKKGISFSAVQEKTFLYNIGHDGFCSNSPDEAMQYLMEQEYPDIVWSLKPHDVHFIPDSYLYGTLTSKIVTKLWKESLDEEKMTSLSKHIEDFEGLKVDEEVFEILKDVFQETSFKNSVIITRQLIGKKGETKFIPFLIVNKDSQTIVHIQPNKSFRQDTKAFSQLQKGLEFFKSTLPFSKKANWRYLKVAYFQNGWDATQSCEKCSKHILGPKTNFLEWSKSLFQTNESILQSDDPTYNNILKYLLNLRYQQGDCITQEDLMKATDDNLKSISITENIFLWSNVGYNRFKDAFENKRVSLLSPFGTGKTSLLKARAKRLLKKGEKIVFLIFSKLEANKKTLLYHQYKREFQDYGQNVQTVQICNIDEVEPLIDNNQESHFFFEEVYDDFPMTKVKEFSNKISTKRYFWMTFQNHEKAKTPEGFFCPQMILPLRYCGNLLKATKSIKDKIILNTGEEKEISFPPRDDPDVYLNRGPQSQVFTWTQNTHFASCVEEVALILSKERFRALVKVDTHDRDSIMRFLQNSSIKDRVISADDQQNLELFMSSNSDQILILDPNWEELVRGIEVPIVVHISTTIKGTDVESLYSRCTQKLILVCEENASNISYDNVQLKCARVREDILPKCFQDGIRFNEHDTINAFLEAEKSFLDVDAKNKDYQTALMIACSSGANELVNELVRLGASLETIDLHGWSAIHHACKGGNIDVFRKICETAKDCLDKHTKNGEKPIHIAAQSGHRDIINEIIKDHKRDINEKTKLTKSTPLHLATSVEMVNHLLDLKADAKLMDGEGKTILHIVSDRGNLEVVKILLKRDENILDIVSESSKMHSIHYAAENGHTEVIKYLIEIKPSSVFYQIKYTEKDKGPKGGKTPLHLASGNGHISVVELLITHGSKFEDHQKDFIVNKKDYSGKTAIQDASDNKKTEVVNYLKNVKNKDGKIAIQLASENGDLKYVKFLIKGSSKDNINYQDENSQNSALHLASKNGNFEVVKTLVQYGKADVTLTNKESKTAAHLSTENGNLNILKFLIEEDKADINEKVKEWQTCFYCAVEKGFIDIVKFLHEKLVKINQSVPNSLESLYASISSGHLNVSIYLMNEVLKDSDVIEFLFDTCKGQNLFKEDLENRQIMFADCIIKNYENLKNPCVLFEKKCEEKNILMIAASLKKKNLLMSLLSFLINEKEKFRKSFHKILHCTQEKKKSLLNILMSHGYYSMKIYCDMVLSLEMEAHSNIHEFTECLRTRVGPSKAAADAIKLAEKYYKEKTSEQNLHQQNNDQQDGNREQQNSIKMLFISAFSWIWRWVKQKLSILKDFLVLAAITLVFSIWDIYTDCSLIVKTFEIMVNFNSSMENSSCLPDQSNNTQDDVNQLIELSSTVSIEEQFGFLLVFVLLPIGFYSIDWFKNDTIGLKGWWKYKIQNKNKYPDVWWWVPLQFFIVPLWPFVCLFFKIKSFRNHKKQKGQERQNSFEIFKKETYISDKAILLEVCAESSFQPLLQLFLTLPCIISLIQSRRTGELVENKSFWSIVSSVLALAWSFSSYISSKKSGALPKLSFGFLVVFVQCLFQISGRMLLVTFLSYALGSFYCGLGFMLGHTALVFFVLFFLNGCKTCCIENGCKTCCKSLVSNLFNAFANMYLQIWVDDNNETTTPLKSKKNGTKETFCYKIITLNKGFYVVQPTYWVEILLVIENIIIFVIVYFKLNHVAIISSLIGLLLFMIGSLLKLIFIKYFHLWKNINNLKYIIAIGRMVRNNQEKRKVLRLNAQDYKDQGKEAEQIAFINKSQALAVDAEKSEFIASEKEEETQF